MPRPGAGRIAVVVKGWPRLSETFIAQELVGLEARGLDLALFSLRHPTDKAVHALHRRLRAPVTYLPEYLYQEPRRVLRALLRARRLPGWERAAAAWLRDLARDPTPNRGRRFGQAAVLATGLPADSGLIYAHFLHTPASVARYAALMTGLPWCFSAHAKDIWTSPDWEKREKLADAQWGVTCTAAGHRHLASLAPEPERIALLHHGLDFARFPAVTAGRPARDGGRAEDPVRLLSVGRAVEKKGLDILLHALALLPRDRSWRWVHVGGGALLPALKALSRRLGLDGRVEWLGALPQDAVIERYRAADLFVLPVRRARDGDQDGLPNVLMEAQLLGLPVLATAAAAVAELVEDGVTGTLVPPDDPAALALALDALIRDPARRTALAAAGQERVRRDFGCAAGLDRLAAQLVQGAPFQGSSAVVPAEPACASPSTPR